MSLAVGSRFSSVGGASAASGAGRNGSEAENETLCHSDNEASLNSPAAQEEKMLMVVISAILPWLVVAVGCWIGLQLLRQSGRVLLRLDAVEQQLAALRTLVLAPHHAATGSARAAPSLPLGSPAPEFELPDLAGKRVALAQFRGRRVLLSFFSPHCGYCVEMAPALAGLKPDDPVPIVVTTGSVDENRRLVEKHHIKCPVLLQTANEVSERYLTTGTPMGYLIDAEGKIASPLAAGAQPLLALASKPTSSGNGRRTLPGSRPLTESRILRTGLPSGSPAPDFKLPRVDGGELSLSEYRGRSVMLVFSDPHCAPCSALASQLREAHRQRPDVPVIMVSRGSVEENREKVHELELAFPVVVQQQWEVSRAYGAFATPVGVLIDERGTIAAEVAQGADQVLALWNRAHNIQSEEGSHVMS
jgi:peroxiredoxin